MADIAIGIMVTIILIVGIVCGYNMMSKPTYRNSAPVTIIARRSERRLSRKASRKSVG